MKSCCDNHLAAKLALVLTCGLFACVWPSVAAEPSSESVEDQAAIEDLKSLEDPTIFKRRVWLETEWNHYKDGSSNLEETLGGLWAWGISSNLDWAVRLKIPYEWHVAGNTSGETGESGLGDIKLAIGPAYRLSPTWRVGGGLELRMPTAQNGLGDDVWKLQEFGTVAWDATRWLSFTPSFEYNQSIAERNGASPQHYLELFFPATFILPKRWSLTPRYELKVDFENGNYVTQSAKFSISKQLESPRLGFTLSCEVPFDNGSKEFQVNFLVTYFFQ